MESVYCVRKGKKRSGMLCSLLTLVLVLSTVTFLQLTFIPPVQASPDTLFYSQPSAFNIDALFVLDGPFALDKDNGTSADFNYEADSPGYFEVVNFSKAAGPISQVDLKMKYTATAATKDGTYSIVFSIDGSTWVELVAPTGNAHSVPPAGCDVWANQPRPGGGSWTWTDIFNIQFQVLCTLGRRGTGMFYEYEAWATVHFTPPAYSTVYVDPASVIDTNLTPETTTTIRPNAAGSFTDWVTFNNNTRSYADWDDPDPHDGDATYLHAEYDYDQQTSNLQDSTGETWPIAAVRVNIVARATDSNSDENLYPVIYYNTWAWDYWGVKFTPTTTYQKYTSEWAKNPETGDYWTWTDIDNLEAGAVAEAVGSWPSGNQLRVTQLYVEVLGPRLSLDIKVDWVQNLSSYEFELTFNPEVIQGVYIDEGAEESVEVGPFLNDTGLITDELNAIPGDWNNTLGRLWLSGAWLDTTDAALLPDGGGTLSIVVFWVIRQGETNITLGDRTNLQILVSGSPVPRDIQLQHGYFRNVDTSLLPVMSFTIAPEDTPPANGTIQGFNVNFTSTSTAAGGKTITTHKWDFWDIYRERFMSFVFVVLRPDADGTYTAWTNDYTYWNDTTLDHDTTYVSTGTPNLNETSNLQDYTAETWTISKVTIRALARQTGENLSMRLMLVVGADGYYGQTDHTPTSTYAPYTEEWDKNPATDSAWTWSDINALQAGVRSKNISNTWAGELRVTQLYIEVSAPPPTLTDTPTLLRNYVTRGTKNVTLTVIDNTDVVGTKTGTITIKSHDIYFTRITTNTTRGQYPVVNCTDIGDIVNITVTAVNEGDFTESFDVSTFWSVLQAGEYQREVIGTQTVTNLVAGANKSLNFYWDTYGRNVTHPDAFGISANASRISYEWDIEWGVGKIAPNEFKGDPIRVKHPDIAITKVSLFNYLLIKPNGDGTYTLWKNGSYLDWDDQPPGHDGDATYISADAKDLYESSTLQDSTAESWSIGKVRVTIFARTDVITDEQVQLMLVNSTTGIRYISTEKHTLTNETYSKYSNEWTKNPATSSDWTWSDIDALEAGVKSTQGGYAWTGEIRVTQLYVEVLGPPSTALSVIAGDVVDISVTVLNEGDFNATSLGVTTYYGANAISTQTISVITNKSFSDNEYAYYGLPDNYTITLEFLWDTTSVSDGTYAIKAIADTIPNEYDTYDNTYIDGDVTVGAAVPEFPLGAALEIALLAAIIYVWWKRKPKTKPKNRLLQRA